MPTNHVYAILAACEPPMVKFGMSTRPDKRLCEVQVGCPHNVEIAAMVKAPRSLEARIHTGLRYLRVRGEWFKYEHEAVELVELMGYSDADGIYKYLDCLAHKIYCDSLELTPDSFVEIDG